MTTDPRTRRWVLVVFGIAIAVALFAGAGGYATASTFVDGFGPALGASAALSALGAVLALGVPSRGTAPAAAAAAVGQA